MKALFFLICLSLTANLARASVISDPQVLYSRLSPDLLTNDEGGDCSLRSDVWAYELEKITGTAPAKVLLLYTRDEPSRHGWVFHIAPALKVGETWQVFEKANGVSSPLSLNEWMIKINSGSPCELQTAVPASITAFFNQHSGGYHEYDPDSQSGHCLAFVVSASVSKPEEGFLDFTPNYSAKTTPSSLDKAIESCASYSGRFRYGSEWRNGSRVKASAIKDETAQAREACRRELDKF